MAQYSLFYFNGTRYLHVQGMLYDTTSKKVVPAAATAPKPPQPPTTTPTSTRSFDLPLGKVSGKKPFGFRYGDMMVRGDGYVTFNSDHIVLSGAAPRLYVYDEKEAKRWKNIEVIVEYMRVSENNPPSYAGLGIGVRSMHHKQTKTFLEVPTYYVKHCFDSRFHFEKEWEHHNSYTKTPAIKVSMKPNTWNRMVFTVKTTSNGENVLSAELNGAHTILHKDTGKWDNNDPIKDGVSCFIRSDAVKDFRVRKFSIREISST